MAKDNLKSKTIKGAGWSAADAILGQGVSFFVGIVLARLLSPEEYGLIGIVMIFVTVLNGVVDSGFSTAIIRKKDANDDDYNTMFYTNMVFSIILYVILVLCSPFIASFFERQALLQLVPAMGLILIINALSLTQYTILTKRIDFKTKTKASLISSVTSGVVGILCAYMGYGVWSLVIQKLIQQTLYTLLLWIFNKWWPSIRFSKTSFLYMWGFGWKMLLSGLLNNIWNQIYQMVVGKFYNPATLGQYTRARDYARLFSENLTMIVQRVSYPALAGIQDDQERMVKAYRKVIKVTMFVTAICMISLGAVAEPLIICLIGEKWLEAATYLPLICISMSLYPLHAINLNMLQVQGRSDIFLYLEIIKKVIAVGPICLGIFVSIKAMLLGSIGTGIIYYILNSYYTGKKLHYSSWMQLNDIKSSYVIACVIAISVYFIKFLPLSCFFILMIQIVTAAIILFAICELTKPTEYLELKEITKNVINKIQKKEWMHNNLK